MKAVCLAIACMTLAVSTEGLADHGVTVDIPSMSETRTINLIGHEPSEEQVRESQAAIQKIKEENAAIAAKRPPISTEPINRVAPPEPIRVIIVNPPQYQQ